MKIDTLGISKIFMDIISLQKNLEYCKQELSLRPDYGIFDNFLIMAGKNTHVDFQIFSLFLQDLGVKEWNSRWAQTLYSSYCDSHGKLTAQDFSRMIQPEQKEYQLLLNCRKGNLDPQNLNGVHLRSVRICFILNFICRPFIDYL